MGKLLKSPRWLSWLSPLFCGIALITIGAAIDNLAFLGFGTLLSISWLIVAFGYLIFVVMEKLFPTKTGDRTVILVMIVFLASYEVTSHFARRYDSHWLQVSAALLMLMTAYLSAYYLFRLFRRRKLPHHTEGGE